MLLDSRLSFVGSEGAGVVSLLDGALVESIFVDSAGSFDLGFAFSFPLFPKKSLALDGCDFGSGFLDEEDEDLGASWTSFGLAFTAAGLDGTDADAATAKAGDLRVRRLVFGLVIIPYLWYDSRGSSVLEMVCISRVESERSWSSWNCVST